MKDLILLISLILLFSLGMAAKPVSREDAEKCAINFYSFYAQENSTDFSVKEVIIHQYNHTISFYTFVFNAGGFVIISADDMAVPVLGYSFTSPVSREIENPAIQSRFNSYKKQIEQVKTLKTQNPELAQMWDNIKTRSLINGLKAAGPLLLTEWNQEPYYNVYCPPNTPTGCVATAMAQIMNYHQWPVKGNGFHTYIPADVPSYGKQSADFSATTYDWATMEPVKKLTSTSTELEKVAIATLMYHCGVSVDMNYKTDGSGAYSQDVVYSLTNYFLYDHSTIQYIQFDVNQQTEWLDLIKNEIDNNRPVYYDGSDEENGGHAWVCDGYDNFDKLHINWGWGGSYNGYFAPSAMSPGTYSFTESNSAIIGIQPGNPSQEMLWVKQASGFTQASRGIRYISAIDKRTAWAVGYDATSAATHVKEFTRTVNGGETWTYGIIDIPNTTNFESSMICAMDENTAWVPLFGPSGGGMIAKTSDGGKTWTRQETATFSAPDGFPNIVHFWDENNGFCQGDPNGGYFELYTTTNGGNTWTRVPQGNIPANLSLEYGTIGHYDVFGDIIWFATNKGRIYRSMNRGLNWEVFQTPITGASFEISFKDASTGIIQIRKAGDKSAYISQDGGANWSSLNYTGNFYSSSFKYVPGSDMLISCGSDYQTPSMGISYSTDDGASFTEYADYYKNFQFLTLGVANNEGIWAGCFNDNQYRDGMWHFGEIPFSSSFKTSKGQLCDNENVTLTDESTGWPETWEWDFGDGAIPATANGKGPHSVSYNTDGGKTITLTTSKNGENHTRMLQDILYVASDVPSVPGDITGNIQVNAGQKHEYSVENVPGNIYKWTMPTIRWTGSSATNSVQVSFSLYAKSDTLRVTAKNACGVSDTSKLFVTVLGTLGIDDKEMTDHFMVYPNPASEKIFIKNLENNTIQLINSDGRLILVKKITSDFDEIDISKLAPGIYYLCIPDKNRIIYKPISKI